MKRTYAAVLLLMAVSAAQAASPQPDLQEMAASLAKLTEIVRELRADAATEKLRRQDDAIARIASELDLVRGQREQLEEMERTHAQEIQSLVEKLSQPALQEQERTELESLRSGLMQSPAQIQSKRSELILREAKLQDRLRAEQHRKSELAGELRPR